MRLAERVEFGQDRGKWARAVGWIKEWLIGLVFLGILAVVMFGSTGFVAWASIQNIIHFRKLGIKMKPLPATAQMTYSAGKAQVLAFDKGTGRSNDIVVYGGTPRWKEGQRSAERVQAMIKREFLVRGAALLLVVVPIFLFFAYVLVTRRIWLAGVPLALIVAEQFVPFVLGPDVFDEILSF